MFRPEAASYQPATVCVDKWQTCIPSGVQGNAHSEADPSQVRCSLQSLPEADAAADDQQLSSPSSTSRHSNTGEAGTPAAEQLIRSGWLQAQTPMRNNPLFDEVTPSCGPEQPCNAMLSTP